MEIKKVTIAEIAELSGVSAATVSRVLNHQYLVKPDTRNRVMSAIDTLGYKFSDESKIQQSKNKGLFILNIPSLDNPFYSDLVAGAKSAADRYGYHLLVNQEEINSDTFYRLSGLFSSVKIAGLITTNSIPRPLLTKLSQMIPMVQCCEYDDQIPIPYVCVDNVMAMENATEHLLALGCRKIAMVNGPIQNKYARDRKLGYLNAMKKAGINVPSNWILQLSEINFFMALSAILSHLASDDIPDAYITVSDIYAAAAVRAAAQRGISIPKDLMVVGFDNVEISMATTPLITTINLPRFQLGYIACELLVERIRNPVVEQKRILLNTELILRESTYLLENRHEVALQQSQKLF